MAGVRGAGTSEMTEYVANQRTVTVSKGAFSSTITWTYLPTDSGTRVTAEVDYTVNVPVLQKLAEAFLVKLNENEAETLLANLKARMEA